MSNSVRMALLALCLFMWLPGQAMGQGPQCGPSEAVSKLLSEKFKERPIGTGVTTTGALLVVWSGPSGSWSIVVHMPNGGACIVSSGDGWRVVPVQDEGDPAA